MIRCVSKRANVSFQRRDDVHTSMSTWDWAPSIRSPYYHFMRSNLFSKADFDLVNCHVPNGLAEDYEAYCDEYEQQIREAGGYRSAVAGDRNGWSHRFQ